jgi:hypothetical protein
LLIGLPRFLFPCGFHSAPCLKIFPSSIRLTWPYHLSCCSSISCTMFSLFLFLFWLLRF